MKRNSVSDYITQALFYLMQKKDFREITITEIVQKAGVCRASFYRSFQSSDEVLDIYLKEMFGKITGGEGITLDNVYENVLQSYRVIKSHKTELEILQKQGMLDRMSDYFYESALRQIARLDMFHNRYQAHFFAGGSFATVKAWIANGFAESEEEMTDILFELLGGYLEK